MHVLLYTRKGDHFTAGLCTYITYTTETNEGIATVYMNIFGRIDKA